MERWRAVKGYEGLYEVSDCGRVRSLDRYVTYPQGHKRFFKGKILKPREDKNGYLVVVLSNHQNQKWSKVHRLVAQAFLENESELPEVNHLDGNKKNNTISNLEWCTAKQNANHAVKIGLRTEFGRKPVLQIKNGIVIKRFESMTQAARELGINRSHINGCCHKKYRYRTAGGYEWSFAE